MRILGLFEISNDNSFGFDIYFLLLHVLWDYLQNIPIKSDKAIAAMTIASIAMIAMNISIDSRLIVSIIMLFMFSGAKIFRIRGRNNRNTIETEKNTPETTKMTSEVSAIVDLSVYRIVLSGQRLLEIAASVKVHPQIYARCHRLFFFSD